VEISYDRWQEARCKGMIRSYLKGRKNTSMGMVLAFMHPPYEKPLSREAVVELLQQALPEVRYPIAKRLTLLKGILGVQ